MSEPEFEDASTGELESALNEVKLGPTNSSKKKKQSKNKKKKGAKVVPTQEGVIESNAEEISSSDYESKDPTLGGDQRAPIKNLLLSRKLDSSVLKSSNQKDLDNLDKLSHSYKKTSSNYLLQANFSQLDSEFSLKDSKSKASIESGTESIKKTFGEIKNTVGSFDQQILGLEIDWEFWTKVVNNYQQVICDEPDRLHDAIMKGIPKEIRGIVWQVISKSKNYQMEELYYLFKSEQSVHEKAIKRDLRRTSFFTQVEQFNKAEELFSVIKAYSLFDPDVGYTQGMIFVTTPLIMNMNDSESFCLLVNLMKDHNLRELFCPEMRYLHLLLYKFERLLEHFSPILYNHLLRQRISSSMYASQWFLTFFAYKFPLDIVLRIYDNIITQGLEALLKFGLNLMLKNEQTLLALKFDHLLDFLKNNLFNIYINENYIDFSDGKSLLSRTNSVSKRFSLLAGTKKSNAPSNNGYYRLDDLVYDSMQLNLDPVMLRKFDLEFQNIDEDEKSKAALIEETSLANGELRHKIKSLEVEFNNLNLEHIVIAQLLMDFKFALPEVKEEIKDLQDQIDHLRQEIEEIENSMSSDVSLQVESQKSITSPNSPFLPLKLELNIQELLQVNAEQTEKFAELQERYATLKEEEDNLTDELELKGGNKWFGRWR